ncbi:MAG: hypothetical protein U0103_20655 [Candidatus Obscuribacterales bacterium]
MLVLNATDKNSRSGYNGRLAAKLALIIGMTTGATVNLPGFAQTEAQALPGLMPQTQVMPTAPSAQPIVPSPAPLAQPAVPPTPASPLSFLDISNGGFGKVDLEIDNARLQNSSIDKMRIIASDLDMKAGTLKGLNITVTGGHFPMFVFDQLNLNSAIDMSFDPVAMKNDKVLQFKTPVEAEVSAVISQQSLNAFLGAPQTLEKLSVTANKKVGMIASLLGANASNFGITLSNANVTLQKQNRVSITTDANIGLGTGSMPMPLELNARLGLENGWIAVSDTHLNTNGSEISPTLSEMLVKKVNGLAAWGSKSDDIQFSFTDMKVVPGKQFSLKGTAKISRLRFGQQVPAATE